jgi:hypothetical protein
LTNTKLSDTINPPMKPEQKIMSKRLDAVLAANEYFATAYHNGEEWALHTAQLILGIDGKADRRHPERSVHEDGQRHNWCGQCPSILGCVMCDLDEGHDIPKEWVGRWDD